MKTRIADDLTRFGRTFYNLSDTHDKTRYALRNDCGKPGDDSINTSTEINNGAD